MTACPNAIRAAAGRFHEEQMTRPSRLSPAGMEKRERRMGTPLATGHADYRRSFSDGATAQVSDRLAYL